MFRTLLENLDFYYMYRIIDRICEMLEHKHAGDNKD